MNNNRFHTVLGASGAVGRMVIEELLQRGLPLRAVSRSLDRPGVEAVPADLLDPEQAKQVIEGSTHVYLCVGLPYYARVWKRDWPRLMQNVIDACSATGARLIFLDNIYMYGPAPLEVPFDENHSQQPESKKGKIRKHTVGLLRQAMQNGKVEAVIGRSADFYGPFATNSMLYILFLERMLKGKRPLFIGSPQTQHTFSDVVDLGKALVELALAEDTYGEAWHLPVGRPITIEEAAEIFNQHLGTDFKVSFMPKWFRKLVGVFVPPLREVNEMAYQFDHPYIMSDDKFRKRFPDFEATSYEHGFRRKIEAFR